MAGLRFDARGARHGVLVGLCALACGELDSRAPQVNDGRGDGVGGTASSGAPNAETGGPNLANPGAAGSSEQPGDGAVGIDGNPPGNGAPASLMANAATHDFGALEAAGPPVAFDWVISNTGGSPTGALLVSNGDAGQVDIDDGCAAPVAAGASCTVVVSLSLAAAGPFAGTVRLEHAGQVLELSLSGRGQHRLSVERTGDGEVVSSPAGLACDGAQCTGLFDPGDVVIQARPNPGNDILVSWSSGCRASQDCSFTLDQSRSVAVRFNDPRNNVIFTSSERFPSNLGSVAAYNAECNRLALAAGIGVLGNEYIAAMSDSLASLRQRLGLARGWVRMDGLPLADTPAELFDNLAMQYYVAYDERGEQLPAPGGELVSLNVMTGTLDDGSSAPDNCNDWTSTAAGVDFEIGRVAGGPRTWLADAQVGCELGATEHILCMSVTNTAPVAFAPVTAGAKRMWVANTFYFPGTMTPDAKCQSERPVGVANGVAFVAYTDRPAAAVLAPDALYYRSDGAFVGTGADIAVMDIWAAPWLLADGSVGEQVNLDQVWSGARDPQSLALAAENCNDWADSSPDLEGLTGDYAQGGPRFFFTEESGRCTTDRRLYCVEP